MCVCVCVAVAASSMEKALQMVPISSCNTVEFQTLRSWTEMMDFNLDVGVNSFRVVDIHRRFKDSVVGRQRLVKAHRQHDTSEIFPFFKGIFPGMLTMFLCRSISSKTVSLKINNWFQIVNFFKMK